MLSIALFVLAGDDALTRIAALPKRPDGSTVSALLVGSSGIDASETLTHDPTGDHRAGAFTLRSTTLAYTFDQGIIVRLDNEAEIGGGASDHGAMFQGGLLLSLMGGYRFSFTPHQGPFIRAGVLALVMGNDIMYRSALVLPDAHVGYQYLLSRRVLAEVAWTTGWVLTGRSDGGGGTHSLDLAVATGVIAALHTDPISLTARWMYMIPTNANGADASPVNWLDAALCAEPGKTLALCLHAQWNRDDVRTPAGDVHYVDIGQLGFTLGTQQKKRLHSEGVY